MIETGRAALSDRNKNIIIQELNVNPEWLEHGSGDMFTDHPLASSFSIRNAYRSRTPSQSVPLYNIESTGGLVPIFTHQESALPVDYIHIPNLPKCDGAVFVVGDGMYPLLQSGDIVLYKQLQSIDDVFWGDMYLLSIDIDGEEYITVRYIQKSERSGYIRLVSKNPQHGDKEIALDKILALAFVKASIHLNSIR